MSGVSGEHQGHQGIAGNGIPALVEPSWVQSRLADEATRIFDVTVQAKLKPFPHMRSGRREFKHGHVPGAGFADLRRICDPRAPARTFTMPEAEWFAEKMGRLGIGDENRVVLYDARESMWAARLYWMLRAFGFDNAAVMNGGWTSWSLEHRPVSTDPAAYPPARFTPDQCADLFVGKDDVLAALDDPTTSIVCALGHRQFIGEHREYGRRRGHIPTAKNISAWRILDKHTQRYRPITELRDLLAPVLGAERIITYCGGGVAACSVAFALHLVGHPHISVYDGGLLEWSADRRLPLVVGE